MLAPMVVDARNPTLQNAEEILRSVRMNEPTSALANVFSRAVVDHVMRSKTLPDKTI
jgi:hypothetical protein